MNHYGETEDHSLTPEARDQIHQLTEKFIDVWKQHLIDERTTRPPQIEDFLSKCDRQYRNLLFRELIEEEFHFRNKQRSSLDISDYRRRFPQFLPLIEKLASPLGHYGPQDALDETEKMPARIGRFPVIEMLGKGAYGIVYRARHEGLDCDVAIKVPRAGRDTNRFLREGQILAKLRHPNIVAVYDVDQTEDGICCVVSEYIDGLDLSKYIQRKKPSYCQSAELIAKVANALSHAHQQRIYHRDVKPANILIDESGTPFLADFGLALTEQEYGNQASRVGSPNYMSPEQVRWEAHLVDGRTDIFSLGVVFYQMLTQELPFFGSSVDEVIQRIQTFDPRPPREIFSDIPRELERICMKAMSKRATDRYAVASDMADDLLYFLQGSKTSVESVRQQKVETKETADSANTATVVPKGLRAFDEHDADFFLDLLPGPRDRDGLPESIRFWKTKIDQTDREKTFRVGLIYGPTGCGKSSLVKAGLLPRLGDHVAAVYVEATEAETEIRLLKAITKHLTEVSAAASLADLFQILRQRPIGNRKFVIVIDQFEQWLHAHGDDPSQQLIHALRHCDGGNLQCLVLIRDDFWMPVTRFMRSLEVRLIEDETVKSVDLFSIRHAEKVLTRFGQAYGSLPERITDDHRSFISKSIEGLANGGKVICVQLALFAQMMQDKPWTPASLKSAGGAEGVGVTFLEETFSASTASKWHRMHQQAARGVLEALLPTSGTDIKGAMRSEEELIQASKYGKRPDDFHELLRILNSELRLITPTHPEGEAHGDSESVSSKKYYQLTHDFLVPSLREWITRKRKETRRGRAELRLAELASLWQNKPEKRHLPSLLEFISIRTLTDVKKWSESENQLMRKADQFYFACGTLSTVIIVSIIIAGWLIQREVLIREAKTLLNAALTAQQLQLPTAANNLRPFAKYAVEPLLDAFNDNDSDLERFKAAYVLAELKMPVDPKEICGLVPELPDNPATNANIVTCLQHTQVNAVRAIRALVGSALGKRERPEIMLRFGMLAVNLGDVDVLSEILSDDSDPTNRTLFIHETVPKWKSFFVSEAVVQTLSDTDDADCRSAIALAIGGAFKNDALGKAIWKDVLTGWYQESDSGTHSAADWSMRQLGIQQRPTATNTAFDLGAEKDWQILSNGMALLRIPKGEFIRRNFDGGISTLEKVVINEEFWLSAHEITVRQFQEFVDDTETLWVDPEEFNELRRDDPAELPAALVTWSQAAMFCNWLSKNDASLQQCYKKDVNGSWQLVGNGGYRLPTDAEWEYACRARVSDKHEYTCGDKFYLNQYAVIDSPGTEKVGRKMCNSWGVFDMHGNLSEYCNDSYESGLPEYFKVVRGGNFSTPTSFCRFSSRSGRDGTGTTYNDGFRVALVPSAQPAIGADSGSTESVEAELAKPSGDDAGASSER